MSELSILGVMLNQRDQTALKFQEIVTKYGCNIRTRIGLHPVSEQVCSPSGIILLEVIGSKEETDALENEIRKMQDVQVQKMVFSGKGL